MRKLQIDLLYSKLLDFVERCGPVVQLLDSLYIRCGFCCTACCTTNPQLIEQVEFGLNIRQTRFVTTCVHRSTGIELYTQPESACKYCENHHRSGAVAVLFVARWTRNDFAEKAEMYEIVTCENCSECPSYNPSGMIQRNDTVSRGVILCELSFLWSQFCSREDGDFELELIATVFLANFAQINSLGYCALAVKIIRTILTNDIYKS